MLWDLKEHHDQVECLNAHFMICQGANKLAVQAHQTNVHDPQLLAACKQTLDDCNRGVSEMRKQHQVLIDKKNAFSTCLKASITARSSSSQGVGSERDKENAVRQSVTYAGLLDSDFTLLMPDVYDRIPAAANLQREEEATFEQAAHESLPVATTFTQLRVSSAVPDPATGKVAIEQSWRESYLHHAEGMQLAYCSIRDDVLYFQLRLDTDPVCTAAQMHSIRSPDEFQHMVSLYCLMEWALPAWMLDPHA